MPSASITALKDAGQNEIDAICALKMQHWPHPMEAQRKWWSVNGHPDDLLVRLVGTAGELAAFLRLRSRPVISDGKEINALCATEVCVAKSIVGSGWGRNLLAASSDVIGREKSRIGYLLCRDEQEGFYSKCGWSRFEGPLSIRSLSGIARAPAAEERCFVFDLHRLLGRKLILVGNVF